MGKPVYISEWLTIYNPQINLQSAGKYLFERVLKDALF